MYWIKENCNSRNFKQMIWRNLLLKNDGMCNTIQVWLLFLHISLEFSVCENASKRLLSIHFSVWFIVLDCSDDTPISGFCYWILDFVCTIRCIVKRLLQMLRNQLSSGKLDSSRWTAEHGLNLFLSLFW